MATYRITLEIEHLLEGPYLGTSPDLPGLIVQASTAEEVIRLAPDIAHDLIEVMHETGQALPTHLRPLPTPSRIPLLVPA
jgi:predicted RNase H-like HicB family nuclease